jgi:ppGpp synthetase/RelA/SpoT-type nucleotidyltranferase
MIVCAPLKQKYAERLPYLNILYTNVRQLLLNYCSENGFAFIDRIKTIDSLAEKIETGRYSSWSDVDDFYAATIIIPNLGIEKSVVEFLQTAFKQIELRKRGATMKSPDVFRFDNTRFIGRYKQIGEQTELAEISFEIQIKTAFEHAWSVSTHSLVYKTNTIDWKLLRIAAQLKSSVEQLDMIVSGSKYINSHITEHPWPEINLKKHILEKTNQFLNNPNVPEELKPKDASRFSENLHSLFFPAIKNSRTPYMLLEPYFEAANQLANDLGKDKFPRSLSLIQYFIGIANQLNFDFAGGKYVPFITKDMEDIFPHVKNVKRRFVLG